MGRSKLFSSDNIDGMVDTLSTELLKVYDAPLPAQPLRIRHELAPWLSHEIRRVMAKRDRAKIRLRRESSLGNINASKKLRNTTQNIHSTIENLSQTQVWKL